MTRKSIKSTFRNANNSCEWILNFCYLVSFIYSMLPGGRVFGVNVLFTATDIKFDPPYFNACVTSASKGKCPPSWLIIFSPFTYYKNILSFYKHLTAFHTEKKQSNCWNQIVPLGSPFLVVIYWVKEKFWKYNSHPGFWAFFKFIPCLKTKANILQLNSQSD